MADKLIGSGNVGDFVHKTQGVASDKGFSHISKLWYPKTISYEDGLAKMQQSYDQREDLMVTVKEMLPMVNQDGDFVLACNDNEYKPDDYAVRQLCTKMGFVPTTIVNWLLNDNSDDIDHKVFASCLKNGMRHIDPEKKFRIRTYKDTNTIRAVLTEEYSPVDNRWYLKLMKKLVPDGRLSHWRGDDNTMYGNILIPDSVREEKDSDYGGMISVGNCEIGKRRVTQYPSLFRAICMNGCIWDQTKGSAIARRHRGIELNELATSIVNNVHEQIPLLTSGKLLEEFKATQKLEFGKVRAANIIAEFAKSQKLNGKPVAIIAEKFSTEERENRNLFGIINAITRAGQELDNDGWVKFDELAGSLVKTKADGWNRWLNRAKELTDDEVHNIFAVAVA